ncbi:MAG: hypothetical protein B5766_05805 [Candidatus Lumbricidophila eiseniae]|uniref:ABC transporter domain-containing protein n=1 Tax=Candidatus Lumbricidiphila eiseniae TaxID=1969409 RepID=A0A2A6FS74_9MICO|nr:MAG: hypothetical protein B5766_05805 [Candidatus Lumbricidophila eiseniae]
MSIKFDRVSKNYGKRWALNEVSFTCPTGTITGLLGQNGAGKSTALRCVLGLSHPTQGVATIADKHFTELRQPQVMVGAVLDASAHHPGRSARNTIRLIASLLQVSASRVDDVLNLVGLGGVGGRQFRALSLGMKQRLALAIALLTNPQYLILDEPLNGLDIEGVSWFRELLVTFAREGGTVLVSSHMLAELEGYADRVVTIHQGQVLDDKNLSELPGLRELVIRSSDNEGLITALTAAGLSLQAVPGTQQLCVSAEAELVSQLAFSAGILLLEISPRRSRLLETYYLDLVAKNSHHEGKNSIL